MKDIELNESVAKILSSLLAISPVHLVSTICNMLIYHTLAHGKDKVISIQSSNEAIKWRSLSDEGSLQIIILACSLFRFDCLDSLT